MTSEVISENPEGEYDDCGKLILLRDRMKKENVCLKCDFYWGATIWELKERHEKV